MNTCGYKQNKSGKQMGIKSTHSGYMGGMKTNGYKNNSLMNSNNNSSSINNHNTNLMETEQMVTGTTGPSKTHAKTHLEKAHSKRKKHKYV